MVTEKRSITFSKTSNLFLCVGRDNFNSFAIFLARMLTSRVHKDFSIDFSLPVKNSLFLQIFKKNISFSNIAVKNVYIR